MCRQSDFIMCSVLATDMHYRNITYVFFISSPLKFHETITLFYLYYERLLCRNSMIHSCVLKLIEEFYIVS